MRMDYERTSVNSNKASLMAEESHVPKRGREASVVEQDGGPMVGHPFTTIANDYLHCVENTHGEATVKELRRRLKRMAKDFQTLKERGIIESVDPRYLSDKEILAYLGLLRARGMKESGLAHNFSTLRQLLRHSDNTALDKMQIRYGGQLPKRRSKRLPPMSDKQAYTILQVSEGANEWRRMQAFALVILAIFSGSRTKELRLAKVSDLDRDEWTLNICHPKGENTWGDERRTIVLPQARPLITRYIKLRAIMGAEKAPLNEALFPALRDKEDGYFSTNGLEKLKKLVEEEVGFKFDLRTCRRTFGQMCLDQGVTIESVSVLMGHDSTKTTESYYCQKKEEKALAEVNNICSPKPPAKTNPVISKDNFLAGYG